MLDHNWGKTEILAGGTDLLALMKDDVVAPKRVVNIKDIKDLDGLHELMIRAPFAEVAHLFTPKSRDAAPAHPGPSTDAFNDSSP